VTNLGSRLDVEVSIDEESLLVGVGDELSHEGGRQLQQRTVRQRLKKKELGELFVSEHFKFNIVWKQIQQKDKNT